MTKQSINTGTGVNTGTGDTLRAAMSKINDNFDELYQLIGAGDSSTSTTLETANITTYVTDGQLTLDPRGDGTIVMNAPTIFNDIIRSDDSTGISIVDDVRIDGTLSFGSDATSVEAILDEDTLSSNSNTALATQQSIKAYVDTSISSSNTLTIGDDASTQISIDLDENLDFKGGNSITTTATGDTLTIALDNAITINEISSSDSTGITIKDDLLIDGTIRAEDSGTVNIDGGLSINGAITAVGNITSTGDIEFAALNDGTITITAFIDEDSFSSDSQTRLPTQQSVKAYVDAQDANIASDSLTFTNKTFDVEGTGNSVTNIDVANLKSGVLDTDITSVSGSDDTLASAKAIKTYVDAQVTAQDLDVAADSGTAAVDLDSQSFTVTGGSSITTSATGQAVTVSLDSNIIVNEISSSDSTGVQITDVLNVNEISSTDSTAIRIEDNLNVHGDLTVTGDITSNGNILTTESISTNVIFSNDSTGVTINDDLLIAGTIRSEDSTTVNIDGAMSVSGAVASGAITSSGVVTGTGFTIGSAVIDETDLEKIDGITNGAGAANKALVLDGSANVASGLAAVTASGVVTAAGFTIGSAVIDETDLEKLDGITNGVGAANKALVLDGSANVASGLAAVTASGVVTAAGFTIGSASIVEVDLEQIEDITAGTVIASKAIVTDSDKDITGGRNITITGELDAGSLDIAGTTTIDGLTTLAGSFQQAIHTFVATDAITQAEHAGRILLLGEVGGNADVVLTLPDATGTGNVYEFIVSVTMASNTYKIACPDADNTITGQIQYLDEDGTAAAAFPTVAASDTITSQRWYTGRTGRGYTDADRYSGKQMDGQGINEGSGRC